MTVESVMVRRYQCSHCRRTWSVKRTAEDHEERCWKDPANRACLTCKHHVKAESGGCYERPGCQCQDIDEGCDLGLFNGAVVVGCPAWERAVSPKKFAPNANPNAVTTPAGLPQRSTP